jgi:Protein of unknown function (DUF2752)
VQLYLPGRLLLVTLAFVDGAMPAIYASANRRIPCSPMARLLAVGIAAGCLLVLIIASRLVPSRTGVGTHTSLGMVPCQFLVTTGFPCPGCGMTTSFSLFVRGRVMTSFYVQPMGALLALIAGCCVWGGLYCGITGRAVYRVLQALPSRYYVMPILSWAIAAWMWKIVSMKMGIGGF